MALPTWTCEARRLQAVTGALVSVLTLEVMRTDSNSQCIVGTGHSYLPQPVGETFMAPMVCEDALVHHHPARINDCATILQEHASALSE